MELNDMQLDALREISNIGSGTAATALSSMLGRTVDLSVPRALALDLADAVEAVGSPEDDVTAVVLGVTGDLSATVVLLFDPASAATVCTLLGVDPAGRRDGPLRPRRGRQHPRQLLRRRAWAR